MKNNFFRISRAAALTVCALAATHLQAAMVPKLTATIPFDFAVGKKTLPAGNYSIVSTNSYGAAPLFVVRNERTGNASVALMSEHSLPNGKEATSAQVAFACRENTCFLSELKIPGSDAFTATLPRLSSARKERRVALNARFAPAGK